jgi:hypothetical protein
MSIFKQGQLVWAPKVAGVPADKPENNVYTLVEAIDKDEEHWKSGYELATENGSIFFADTIKNLEDVEVCKECGSDKLQQAVWQENTGETLEYVESIDPFCPDCNETMTRSFHCNMKEYLEYQEEQRKYEEKAMRANED